MIASQMGNTEDQSFYQGTKRTSLAKFYYIRMFCENDVKECFVREKLKLTAKKMLRLIAVSKK